MTTGKLTLKQRKFIEAYTGEAKGNATEAARLAGYKGNNKTLKTVGAENLAKHYIADAVRKSHKNDPLVASGEEIRRFWTDIMHADEGEMRDRLKASELLAKALGQFIEKRIVHNTDDRTMIWHETRQFMEQDKDGLLVPAKSQKKTPKK